MCVARVAFCARKLTHVRVDIITQPSDTRVALHVVRLLRACVHHTTGLLLSGAVKCESAASQIFVPRVRCYVA
jgi:hypothetical protein